jgi:hypothetical protein
MAARKLDKKAQALLRELLAAGAGGQAIRQGLVGAGYEAITDATLSYYRTKWAAEIKQAQKARHDLALSQGLALKAERVRRLADHAEEIEGMRLCEDKVGKPSWAMEWRATLADIAAEMGERRGEMGGNEEAMVKVYIGVDYEQI